MKERVTEIGRGLLLVGELEHEIKIVNMHGGKRKILIISGKMGPIRNPCKNQIMLIDAIMGDYSPKEVRPSFWIWEQYQRFFHVKKFRHILQVYLEKILERDSDIEEDIQKAIRWFLDYPLANYSKGATMLEEVRQGISRLDLSALESHRKLSSILYTLDIRSKCE